MGGRFGPPPLTSVLQPKTSSKWYQSTNFDFFQLFSLCLFYYDVTKGGFQAQSQNMHFKNSKFWIFQNSFFLLKKVKNLKITQKFCYSTFPKCYRGVTSEKPQNIENFEKLFLRRTPLDPLRIIRSTPNFFWRRSTYIS